MNLEQIKRNDIKEEENIKFFTNVLENNIDKELGPATFCDFLTEAFISEDPNFSVQIWFFIMHNLSIFNNASNKKNVVFEESEIIKSKIRLIKSIFNNFAKQNIVLPHFKNANYWNRQIISKLSTPLRVTIYAIDWFLSKDKTIQNYISLEKIYSQEGLKIKIMLEGYIAYMTKNKL